MEAEKLDDLVGGVGKATARVDHKIQLLNFAPIQGIVQLAHMPSHQAVGMEEKGRRATPRIREVLQLRWHWILCGYFARGLLAHGSQGEP